MVFGSDLLLASFAGIALLLTCRGKSWGANGGPTQSWPSRFSLSMRARARACVQCHVHVGLALLEVDEAEGGPDVQMGHHARPRPDERPDSSRCVQMSIRIQHIGTRILPDASGSPFATIAYPPLLLLQMFVLSFVFLRLKYLVHRSPSNSQGVQRNTAGIYSPAVLTLLCPYLILSSKKVGGRGSESDRAKASLTRGD